MTVEISFDSVSINTRSTEVYKSIIRQMDRLDAGLINTDNARAAAQLAKQANNAIRHDIEAANTLLKLEQFKAIRLTGQ